MKKSGWLALLAFAAVSCSHRQPQPTTASAPVSEEAALTGIPDYPRAKLAALPAPAQAVEATPPVVASAVPAAAPPAESAEQPEQAPDVATTLPPTKSAPAASTPPLAATPSSVPAETPPDSVDSTPASSLPASAPATPATPGTTTTSTYDFTTPAPDKVVVLDTSFGRMVIELDDFAAPKTCENFRKLVASGFYNGTIFHRVIPQFIIQGGDPNTRTPDRATYGQGNPGYTLPPEIKLHHDRGAVAMARLPNAVNPQRNSNGSQFYICLAAAPSLDGQYTVFAHVIEGLDVADRIAAAPGDRRNDPLERIEMKASLEPRDRALRESAATGP